MASGRQEHQRVQLERPAEPERGPGEGVPGQVVDQATAAGPRPPAPRRCTRRRAGPSCTTAYSASGGVAAHSHARRPATRTSSSVTVTASTTATTPVTSRNPRAVHGQRRQPHPHPVSVGYSTVPLPSSDPLTSGEDVPDRPRGPHSAATSDQHPYCDTKRPARRPRVPARCTAASCSTLRAVETAATDAHGDAFERAGVHPDTVAVHRRQAGGSRRAAGAAARSGGGPRRRARWRRASGRRRAAGSSPRCSSRRAGRGSLPARRTRRRGRSWR